MVAFKTEAAAGKVFGNTPAAQQNGTGGISASQPQPQTPVQQRQELQQDKQQGSNNIERQHPAVKALLHGRLGVAFSGSGFGAAYQLGAAEVLSSLGVLHATTPVSGCSAGGFVAAACRCSIPFLDVLSALKQASTDLIQHGRNKRMRSTLESRVHQLLPENVHELCTGAGAPPFVLAATKVRGPCPVCWRPDLASSGFSSKKELVDRLLAGAQVPKVSDNHCFARERGHGWFVDGGVKMPVPPIPGVDFTVIIYPMANQLLHRPWPYKLLMHAPPPAAISISPGQYTPWPLTKSYKDSNNLVMHPQPPEVLDMLFERGRRDALAWAQHVGVAATLERPRAAKQTQLRTAAEAVAVAAQTAPIMLLCESTTPRHMSAAPGPAVLSMKPDSENKIPAAAAAGISHDAACGTSGQSTVHSKGNANNPAVDGATGGADASDGAAGSGCGSPPKLDNRLGAVHSDVQLHWDKSEPGSKVSQQLQLLATPVDELPMIVPVPAHLLPMLS